MRTYELLYIAKPDLGDDEVETLSKEVEGLVTAAGGAIERSELWGKRRLAYEVRKCAEGYYVLLRFTGTPELVARLENHFRLSESILRHLVVFFDERTLRLEADQKKRKEAEIRSSAAAERVRGEDEDRDEEPVLRGARRAASDEDEEEAESEE